MTRTLGFVPTLIALLASAAAAGETRAFVTTTDYASGGLRRIDLDTRIVLPGEIGVHTDTRLRWYGGLLYVINRFGQDNIQVVDPAGWTTVRQFSTGNGSNPADIAFASPHHAYVTLYERADLLVVNPQSGATIGSIPLGSFADADGIPEMDHMEKVGPWLLVSLQRLDRANGFAPTDSSLVVVVDSRADTVLDVNPAQPGKQGFRLTGKNPATRFHFDGNSGRLLIGCVGAYGALDGGIEWIDPLGFKSLGWAITEAALGGEISELAWYRPDHSYAIVSDLSFNTQLVSWSAASGSKLATLDSPGGFSLTDLGLDDRGELYVLNGSFTAPGVRVYQAGSDAVLAGPLDTGLPPSQITFDFASGDVAGVSPPREALGLTPPRPNPAREAVRFGFSLARPGEVRIEVYDLAGRRLRVLTSGPRPAGAGDALWDLADQRGARVPPGVYLVRARVPGAEMVRRVVVLE